MCDGIAKRISSVLRTMQRILPVACCAVVLSCAFGDEDAIEMLYGKSENPLFLAVGTDGAGKMILASENGRAWLGNLVSGGGINPLSAVGYGDGRFVALGFYDGLPDASNLFVSPDGFIWGRGNTDWNLNVTDIMFSKGLFLATGMDIPTNTSAIWASLDGLFFFEASAPAVPAQMFRGVACGNGRFVAVGDYVISVSEDGLAWSSNLVTVPTYGMQDVAYGGGVFVAVGESGRVIVSPDGLAWSEPFYVHESCGINPCHLNAVTYDSGKFVAVGDQLAIGAVFVSPNGLVWTGDLHDAGSSLVDVTGCNGTFVAVTGGDSYTSSYDGLSWNTGNFSPGTQIFGVTCRP